MVVAEPKKHFHQKTQSLAPIARPHHEQLQLSKMAMNTDSSNMLQYPDFTHNPQIGHV